MQAEEVVTGIFNLYTIELLESERCSLWQVNKLIYQESDQLGQICGRLYLAITKLISTSKLVD